MNVYIHCCKVEKRTGENHRHKKKYSLETCAWLLLMLLQEFSASARPHGVHTKKLLPKSAAHFSYSLKLNNIILNSFIHNWFHLFNSKNSCTEIILVNDKHLLYILYIYCTNWLKVILCQE